MWGGLTNLASNLAEQGANLLAELDERIDDDEEEYDDKATHGHVGNENSDSDDDIDAVLPQWASGSEAVDENDPSTGGSSSTATATKTNTKDLAELQQELAEVKAMREDIKAEVAQHMDAVNNDLAGAMATLGAGGENSSSATAAADAVNANLLARATAAEQRLQDAEVAMQKLKEITLKNRHKLAAAREAQSEVAELRAKLALRAEETAQAEEALSALTQAQSAARVDMENELQDLQSKARRESEDARAARQMAEQLQAEKMEVQMMYKELHEQQEQLRATHAQALEDHAAALSAQEDATKEVMADGDYDDVAARMEALDTKVLMQQQVLEETREELDSHIAMAAASEKSLVEQRNRT
jgi:hypothetical protein